MKVGIIAAMEEEVAPIQARLQDRQDTTIAGFAFSLGSLEGCDVVLLKSDIGKVNAAMGATLLIEQYQPDYIINIGSAGGVHADLEIGDIVIAEELCYHDVDIVVFNYEYGQIPGMPATYPTDQNLLNLSERVAIEMMASSDLQVLRGMIATGDAFISKDEHVASIKEKFPLLHATEMEACAIAQVCHRFETPFIVIRAISDVAGKDSNIAFEQFIETAAANAANLVTQIIKAL